MTGRYAIVLICLLGAAGCSTTATSPSLSDAPSDTPSEAPSSVAAPSSAVSIQPPPTLEIVEFPVAAGSRPHDVAPAGDGGVWYTGQANGTLGHLNPVTGEVREVALGEGSAPHGVVVGPDGAPWVTDGGLNAIVRINPSSENVVVYRLPADRPNVGMHTPTFDADGILWFTGQNGVYGRFDSADGDIDVFDAPGGRGPYGIDATPAGDVWYASLSNSYVARIDPASGAATVVDPPTRDQGARRIWSDSRGRLWVAEWNAGQVAVHDPADGSWREWRLPGDKPQAYAVFVDDRDIVWLTDFGANAIVRFDPATETFTSLPLPSANAEVRQLAGRTGEVWGAESGADKLVVVRTE